MDQARNFRSVLPDMEARYRRLRMLGGVGIGWQGQDLHPLGVAGDATAATAELGARITDQVTAGLAELVEEVSIHPLSSLVHR